MQSNQDLAGKVYVVTGANSGIGYEAALDFANRGASLALICRNEERGQKALSDITAATGNTNVRLYLADFCLLASVGELATRLLHEYPGIDVLCNNAGSANASLEETNEGFGATFAANHLSGFLLTYLLLPALSKADGSDKTRIVFTSSVAHTDSPLDFEDLNMKQYYSGIKAYGRSKLMNLLAAREFQRRYAERNVVFSSFHPGGVRTALWGKGGLLGKTFGILFYPFMINSKKGADTLIWLAAAGDDESINADGNYFFKRKQEKTAEFATDEAAEKLWNASMELIKPYLPS